MRVLIFAALILAALPLRAEPIYLVQGFGFGAPIDQATALLWTTETVLMNRGTSDAQITLLSVSNGGVDSGVRSFSIPAGRSVALQNVVQWRPTSADLLWVLRVDVPSTVVVENFLRIGYTLGLGGTRPPTLVLTGFGKTPLPLVRNLSASGVPQVHLGTDLGRDQSSRLNVAIYNFGAAQATATIEVRNHCDDALLQSRTVTVPADTLMQFGDFSAEVPACVSGGPESIYTTVTATQPSFSFVSVLSRREIPLISFALAHSLQ